MVKLREKDIERKCVLWAKQHGWFPIKLVGNPMARRGLPDRMFLKGGKVVFVEFKTPDGTVTPLQRLCHQDFATYGVFVYISRSQEDFITHMLKEEP